MTKTKALCVLTLASLASCSGAHRGTVDAVVAGDVDPGPQGRLAVDPSSLDFRGVCPGETAEEVVELRNVGSGELDMVRVALTKDSSAGYELTIPATSLAPGERVELTVSYTPTGASPDVGELWLEATGPVAEVRVPLMGHERVASLTPQPAVVDFGAVELGRLAKAEVRLVNPGADGISIFKLRADTELPPEVLWVTAPGLPHYVGGGSELKAQVGFRPDVYADPPDAPIGRLEFTSDACQPLLEVPLHGWAGGHDLPCPPDGSMVETFEGRDARPADVLFVVDDSESMAQETAAVAASFAEFIQLANALAIDYRIGVTTTDVEVAAGALQGDPPVVGPSDWQAFLDNVQVGLWGSTLEQGLAAAAASLASPEGFGAYLRHDALLVLVFVSDEEDKSPEPVATYHGQYLAAKGGDPALFLANAIVGPAAGCDHSEPGLRYLELASAAGGAVANICQAPLTEAMIALGEASFGRRLTFELAGPAVAGSVTVTVAGAACTTGWSLGSTRRHVRFEPEAACLPAGGEEVVIRYELVCP